MQLANADRDLDGLGVSPAQLAELPQLIEHYCGAKRLTATEADALLDELGAAAALDWARSSAYSGWTASNTAEYGRSDSSSPPSGSFGSPPSAAGSSRPSARFHKSPTLTGLGVASSIPPPEPEPLEKAFSAPAGGYNFSDEDEETVPAAESPSAMLNGAVSAWSRSWSSAPAAPEEIASSRPPAASSAFGVGAERARSVTPASGSAGPAAAHQVSSRPPLAAAEAPPIFELPEPKDGPLTQRMSAREIRAPGRPAFSGGLAGAEDLPEFPVRTPQPPRNIEKTAPATPQSASENVLSEQTDNFEILVDEEILEIEPDDALIEEIEG